ncbi:MAG: hypothetical protein NZ914_14955 [Gemmatales bacterium]|nr:hypothetical protein [Gemmatales bacterium]
MAQEGEFRWAAEVGHSVEYQAKIGPLESVRDPEIIYFDNREHLKEFLHKLEQLSEQIVLVFKDYGIKPVKNWFLRLIGYGSTDWQQESCFLLSWCDDFATLTFFDKYDSQYCVLSKPQTPEVPMEIRQKLGEGEPVPIDECLPKSVAFAAAREFLDTETRPNWLWYRYVR